MTASDLKRLERMSAAVARAHDLIQDAQRRGLLGDWKGATGKPIADDLAEFVIFQDERIERERRT